MALKELEGLSINTLVDSNSGSGVEFKIFLGFEKTADFGRFDIGLVVVLENVGFLVVA